MPTPPVDLDRYPIDRLDADAGRALVASCREQVEATGACELPDFVPSEATAAVAAETAKVADRAHHHEGKSTPYLELPDEHWPEGHPRKRWDAFSLAALPYADVPETLQRLYTWDPLMEFVRRALGLAEIHRYADPLGCCSVNVFQPGDRQNWHFDHTDFVVSIALQAAEAGGDFFFTPKVRSPEAERYDDVARVLDGDDADAVRVPMRPGTLVLFQGRYSLHRVSRVEGTRPRLVALLAYDTKPGTCASPLLQQARYGRVQQPA